jgi:hypothetical protein
LIIFNTLGLELFYAVWDFLGEQLVDDNTDAENIRLVRIFLLKCFWWSIKGIRSFFEWLAILDLTLQIDGVDQN